MSNETFVFMNWSDGNTSNGRKIKLLSRMQLLANYCNVLACPGKKKLPFFGVFLTLRSIDIPLAPITLNADFVPPVGTKFNPKFPPGCHLTLIIDSPCSTTNCSAYWGPCRYSYKRSNQCPNELANYDTNHCSANERAGRHSWYRNKQSYSHRAL